MLPRFGLALLLAGLGSVPSLAQEASLASVVTFDTVCLQCHEGECSGRLALRTEKNPEGVANHVKGYAGAQSTSTVLELKALIAGLKRDCRLPPPPVALPPDGRWTPAMLSALTLPDQTRLFVPLGVLAPGNQRLSLASAGGAARVRVQVLAQNFDIVVDEEAALNPGGTVAWRADESSTYFLRLMAKTPLGAVSVSNQSVAK
ncbi:conserved exported hypothetical protein [Candidatus Terasakiella magnetica]|nr:conserved exported hypothetical protein [Candidatus Terasakiella magnetica]